MTQKNQFVLQLPNHLKKNKPFFVFQYQSTWQNYCKLMLGLWTTLFCEFFFSNLTTAYLLRNKLRRNLNCNYTRKKTRWKWFIVKRWEVFLCQPQKIILFTCKNLTKNNFVASAFFGSWNDEIKFHSDLKVQVNFFPADFFSTFPSTYLRLFYDSILFAQM